MRKIMRRTMKRTAARSPGKENDVSVFGIQSCFLFLSDRNNIWLKCYHTYGRACSLYIGDR